MSGIHYTLSGLGKIYRIVSLSVSFVVPSSSSVVLKRRRKAIISQKVGMKDGCICAKFQTSVD